MLKFKTIIVSLFLLLSLGLYGCTTQDFTNETTGTNETSEEIVEQINDSYITMSINPSVGIVVDDTNTVVAIHALNEDGEILLLNLDITNKGIEEAFELLLDQSMELGYIDVEATDTAVEISVVGYDVSIEAAIRETIENKVKTVLADLNIPVQVKERLFSSEIISSAQGLNMTPEHYQLMKTAMESNPQLTLDEAQNSDAADLVRVVRENSSVLSIGQTLKDDFLAAKQVVLDSYLPLIEQKEADIASLTDAEELTDVLLLELEALVVEMEIAMKAVVNGFVVQTTSLRAALQLQFAILIEQNRQKVEEHRSNNNNPNDTGSAIETSYSYVTMSINPSVGFIVDESNTVIAIHPLNVDGEMLLLELDVTNMHIDAALELLLDKTIDLGYIDVNATDTSVEISVVGRDLTIEANVREVVENRVIAVLEARHVSAHVKERIFSSEMLTIAQGLNVTPQHYQLMELAMEVDLELTVDEAKLIVAEELIKLIREKNMEMAGVAQALKDEFLVAKQAVIDIYLPQIEALEASIIAAIELDEATADLELSLVALIEEMEAEVKLVIMDFVQQTINMRLTMMTQYQDLIEQNKQRINDFLNDIYLN